MRRPPVRAAVARATRRHRAVLMAYPGLRMGNILYFALHADLRQRAGHDVRVLEVAGNDWSSAFPRLRGLLLPPAQLRFADRRVDLIESFFQGYDSDFTGEDLTYFIQTVLLENADLAGSVGTTNPADDGHAVTINVRRGDYYENPYFTASYGFDVQAYVRSAIHEVEQETGGLSSIVVVSDGPQWCRENLSWLGDHAPAVRFEGPEAGVLGNFATIASSRRLIIANSTFSYWGAYVSNVVRGDNHDQVWVPDLHSRAVDGGRPWQHDPRWRVVRVGAGAEP